MNKQQEALKLALEALESDPLDMVLNPDGHMGFRKDQAITAIREALAEMDAKREFVGLTDEAISNIWCKVSNTDFVTADTHEFARAIESAHGIKGQA